MKSSGRPASNDARVAYSAMRSASTVRSLSSSVAMNSRSDSCSLGCSCIQSKHFPAKWSGCASESTVVAKPMRSAPKRRRANSRITNPAMVGRRDQLPGGSGRRSPLRAMPDRRARQRQVALLACASEFAHPAWPHFAHLNWPHLMLIFCLDRPFKSSSLRSG
jgi:hypothetical protein